MDNSNIQSDMAEYFDFGEAAMPDVPQDHTDNAEVPTIVSTGRSLCLAHGTDSTDGCICNGFMGDYEIQEPTLEDSVKAEWNNDFSSWIPRYSKPEHACDYCRSRHLECFITYEGQSACSPCSALFRPCSFSQPGSRQQKSKHALDTLDVVREDAAHCFGGLTGIKPMRCLGHIGPIERDDDENDKDLRKGSARFARSAVKILKDWMNEHIDHPYPTEEDKEELKNKTGLTSSQISNWMANTRRRQKARPKRAASPSLRPSTAAINIPSDRNWESMNPFERWKHSPPENEPAPLTAIAKAVENFDPPEPPSLSSSYGARKQDSNGSSGSFSVFRAPSTTSLETGFTNFSSGSAQSLGSAWSHGSRNSLNSFNSLNSNSKKDRRRRHRVPPRMPKPDLNSISQRLFQCTFCTDRFKSKYDWSRHEKSLHLSLEKWICTPLGDVITCSASGQRKCVYCDALDPSAEHLETHNHSACEEKGLEARTFYRKDHLRQHLRLMHSCKMTPSMENWKSEVTYIKSRCGFCAQEFTKWQDRVDHLAKEFRNGAQMKDWKGCRGLEAHVAAQVTNAMPPYLIANESKSPFPFSASNTASMAHHTLYLTSPDLEAAIPTAASCTGGFSAQEWGEVSLQAASYTPHSDPLLRTTTTSGPCISPSTWTSHLTTAHSTTSPTSPQQLPGNSSSSGSSNPPPNSSTATCWEILTLRLGRFARQQMEQGGSVPDELLQRQARRILYGDDDPWNQTEADNPEWLALFKKAHGIEAAAPGFNRRDALEDLGVLGDVAAFERLLDEGRWGVQQGVAAAAAEGAAGEWGAIPETECVGDRGEVCVGEGGEIGGGGDGADGGLDCFRFEQWEQLPEFAGVMGTPQMMRWDESELALGMDFST